MKGKSNFSEIEKYTLLVRLQTNLDFSIESI